MGETGKVIHTEDGLVTVVMERTEACAKCRACTMGMTTKEMLISAKNLCGAKLDDWVNIELDGNDFLQAILIMYGLPLVFMLAGFGAGYGASGYIIPDAREILGFFTGFCAMLLSYAVIKYRESSLHAKKRHGGERFMPRATRIVANDEI